MVVKCQFPHQLSVDCASYNPIFVVLVNGSSDSERSTRPFNAASAAVPQGSALFLGTRPRAWFMHKVRIELAAI